MPRYGSIGASLRGYDWGVHPRGETLEIYVRMAREYPSLAAHNVLAAHL